MYKVGDDVTCVRTDYMDDTLITKGKSYKVKSFDNMFKQICVECDIKKLSLYFSTYYFEKTSYIRKIKLEKLNKICTK